MLEPLVVDEVCGDEFFVGVAEDALEVVDSEAFFSAVDFLDAGIPRQRGKSDRPPTHPAWERGRPCQ